MAKSKNENINVSIFTALKVSEVSGVPVLIMSNPGIGKSTTVSMFAEVRGYHLELLRGNSTTENEVLGYDVLDQENSNTTKHTRPSWYTRILEKEKEGKATLLFLDEITTANAYVQAALLHLVFERCVGSEKLPSSTIIVSAGNYAENLDNTMNMLAPLMNRFMIYNIIPEVSDLDIFLSKYRGAIASPTGETTDRMEELYKTMSALDSQEDKTITETLKNKVGEHIERCIYEVTKMLWQREKLIDLQEKDLKSIYSDCEDTKLHGFVTFRTLNYLRDVTLAMWCCFGKAGLVSDNYRNMIDGLCGIGVVKDGKGNIKVNKIGKIYFDHMRNTVNEIEKMKNDTLPQYENFFFNVIDEVKKKKKKVFEKTEMQAIINKMEEMRNDKAIQNIERPIDISIIKDVCSILKDTGTVISDIKVGGATAGTSMTSVVDKIDTSALAGKIEHWNLMLDLYESFSNLVSSSVANYKDDAKTSMSNLKDDLKRVAFCLMSVRKIKVNSDPSISRLIPTMKNISSGSSC